MAIITFPDELRVSRLSWQQQRQEIFNESPFGSQSQEVSGPLWTVSIELDRMREFESGKWKALLMKLRGRRDQLALWDLARPVPRGTLRGSLTLKTDVLQGATSMILLAGWENSGATLLQGDLLGIGSMLTQQVVMCTADAACNSESESLSLDFVSQSYGVGGPIEITVQFEAPLRNAFPAGTPVIWDKPKALFRRQNAVAGWDYELTFVRGFRLDLLEDWRI